MNQITEIPRPAPSEQVGREQAGREQVGEVLAAWPVAPGALLLLGWQETLPPTEGTAQLERRRADRGPFRCLTWPRAAGSHAFLAAVRLPPATEPQPGQLLVLHGEETLPLLARLPAAFDPAPAFAEAAARLAGTRGGSIARFLCDMVPAAALSRIPAFGEMLATFLSRVCADDGCVELTGSVPEGCTFLQGWGRPHAGDADGDAVLVGERVSRHAVQAARFDRPDIVAPATGSLLVLPTDAAADLPGFTQLYLLVGQDVWRRKRVERKVLGANESASHLRAMLPSLRCPPPTADCLRASLKPRFEGRDTLHDRSRSVRAGIDLAVAAGGGCYLTGWLFDPADLVAALHLHGAAFPPAGVRLDTAWTRVARADVTDAFAAEPSLPRPQHHDHGFAAFAPPAAGPARPTPLHLAATFRDGHVAFLPLTVCDADAAVRGRMLASVDLHKPSGLAVIERQLGPTFRALKASRGAAELVFTTAARPDARHAIVIPLLDEPVLPRMVLSQFLTDRLADDETLVLVCGAAWAAAKLDELRRRLAFCGLPAVVLRAPAGTGVADALAMAAEATRAADFLLLGPATAGASPGWRAALRAGAAAHGPLACACPSLLYEDWSVRWAGGADLQRLDTAPYVAMRQERAGLPAAGVAADASTLGTVACCLVSRAALVLVADGTAGVTPFGQEAGFFLDLAAAGVSCRWVPDARAYAVDDPAERPAEPSVGRLVDGWCLRERLRVAGPAGRRPAPAPSHTHEHSQEMAACAS